MGRAVFGKNIALKREEIGMILQPKVWLSVSKGGRGRRLRLSAAHNEWSHVGIALVAMEEGFFAREGLTDVELISFEEGAKNCSIERPPRSICWPKGPRTSP